MRLGLVFNPFTYKPHETHLRTVQDFFGLFPPLSLAWVAAIAEQAGHETRIIDARTLGLSVDETVQRLREFRPDLVGYMLTTDMFQETLAWIRAVKAKFDAPVIVGGANMRFYPDEAMANPELSYGVLEHSLETLPAFLAEYAGGRRFENVPGLIWRENGQLRKTPPRPVKFDDFPRPLRRDLPNDKYAEIATETHTFTAMITSLGCPFGCVFCDASNSTYNPRSPEKILDEMEECCRKYGAQEIDIMDYEFTIDPKRTAAICEGIIARKLDFIWACRSRVTSVDDEKLKLMARAGCERIYFGIEAATDERLAEFNKGITVARIKEALKLARKNNIKALGFFLVGAPGDTAKSVRETIRFAASLDLDYAQFSKVTAKPGARLFAQTVAQTGDYWRGYVLGQYEARDPDRPWTELKSEDVTRLTRYAYLRFYLRPMFLLRALLGLRTWAEFVRKAKATLHMIFAD